MTDASAGYPRRRRRRGAGAAPRPLPLRRQFCPEPAGGGSPDRSRRPGDRLVGGIAAVPGEPARHPRARRDRHRRLHPIEGIDSISPEGVEAVITLCEEVCPVFLGKARRVHWGLPVLPARWDDGRRAAPGIPRRPRRAPPSPVHRLRPLITARGAPTVQGPGLRSPDVPLHGRVRPQVDPALVRFAADLEWLRRTGSRWSASTSRRSPPPSSGADARPAHGRDDTLPLLLVDGKIASHRAATRARGARRARRGRRAEDEGRARRVQPARRAAPDALGGSASSSKKCC